MWPMIARDLPAWFAAPRPQPRIGEMCGRGGSSRCTLPVNLRLSHGGGSIPCLPQRERELPPSARSRGVTQRAGRIANLDSVEVGATEQASGMRHDSRSQESQARTSGRGVDDDDQSAVLDPRDSEAFRSGHVEVAFERLLAASELIRSPHQRAQDGCVVGDN